MIIRHFAFLRAGQVECLGCHHVCRLEEWEIHRCEIPRPIKTLDGAIWWATIRHARWERRGR